MKECANFAANLAIFCANLGKTSANFVANFKPTWPKGFWRANLANLANFVYQPWFEYFINLKIVCLCLQLRIQKEAGKIFIDFHEQAITFGPTYKFKPNSDIYDTSKRYVESIRSLKHPRNCQSEWMY